MIENVEDLKKTFKTYKIYPDKWKHFIAIIISWYDLQG